MTTPQRRDAAVSFRVFPCLCADFGTNQALFRILKSSHLLYLLMLQGLDGFGPAVWWREGGGVAPFSVVMAMLWLCYGYVMGSLVLIWVP